METLIFGLQLLHIILVITLLILVLQALRCWTQSSDLAKQARELAEMSADHMDMAVRLMTRAEKRRGMKCMLAGKEGGHEGS